MEANGHSFLDKVLDMVKAERQPGVPLIEFKQPKELEELLAAELSLGAGWSEGELERGVRRVLRYSVHTDQPAFRNQLYGGTDPYGLAGAWLAEAFNTSQYTYEVAPVFTLIERAVLSHVLSLFGMPQGEGIFSPGGSCSMMYAVAAARYHAFPDVKTRGLWALPQMVLFTSEDSHYSIQKAAHWLGFGTENVKVIPTNDQGEMLTEELIRAIEETKSSGKHPLMVNATAGTTVLGAFDDLEAIADICEKYNVWMHVDACWGGSLILSTTHKHLLNGIHRARSVSWNPHKLVGAPLQCALLLVAPRGLLLACNAAAAAYLFQPDKGYDVRYDSGDRSVQCGRKIDAFKLWVLWRARGDGGLAALVDGALAAAARARGLVRARAGFRHVPGAGPARAAPNVCFWYVPAFMRGRVEDDRWWDTMHEITPKIKQLLTTKSKLMVAYMPLRRRRNFFRLAFTAHPPLEPHHVDAMLDAIQECGEMITEDMLQ